MICRARPQIPLPLSLSLASLDHERKIIGSALKQFGATFFHSEGPGGRAIGFTSSASRRSGSPLHENHSPERFRDSEFSIPFHDSSGNSALREDNLVSTTVRIAIDPLRKYRLQRNPSRSERERGMIRSQHFLSNSTATSLGVVKVPAVRLQH